MKKKANTPQVHVAASAAESDLIKLTHEFEALRSQLEENDAAVKEHHDAMDASRIDFDIGINYRQKKIEHLRRLRRVLESQFTNVTELLQKQTATERACNGCVDQPVGYSPHPLFR